jgi:hypothetical protein
MSSACCRCDGTFAAAEQGGGCAVKEKRVAALLGEAESGRKSSEDSLVGPIGTPYAFLIPALDSGVQR